MRATKFYFMIITSLFETRSKIRLQNPKQNQLNGVILQFQNFNFL